jgi:hypothetical protein
MTKVLHFVEWYSYNRDEIEDEGKMTINKIFLPTIFLS